MKKVLLSLLIIGALYSNVESSNWIDRVVKFESTHLESLEQMRSEAKYAYVYSNDELIYKGADIEYACELIKNGDNITSFSYDY